MLAILICLCNLYLVAGLAQLVEQRIRNAWVGSSSLLTGTIKIPREGIFLCQNKRPLELPKKEFDQEEQARRKYRRPCDDAATPLL